MSKVIILNNQTELVAAMSGGVMYGNQPAETYDAEKFVYPIKVTIDEEEKVFTIEQNYKEETKTETTTTTTTTTTKSSGLSKGAIAGIVVGVVLGIALIVGVVLACVL